LLRWSELAEPQQETLRRYFTEQVFPLITPQALTRAPGHPFPLIPNLRLSLAAVVRDPHGGPPHFAYLKVPDSLPRFVPVAGGAGFVPLEEIIRENLSLLSPGRPPGRGGPVRGGPTPRPRGAAGDRAPPPGGARLSAAPRPDADRTRTVRLRRAR